MKKVLLGIKYCIVIAYLTNQWFFSLIHELTHYFAAIIIWLYYLVKRTKVNFPKLTMGKFEIEQGEDKWFYNVGDCYVYSETLTKDWFAMLLIAIAPAFTCFAILIYAIATFNVLLIFIWLANCNVLWLSQGDINNINKYITTKHI